MANFDATGTVVFSRVVQLAGEQDALNGFYAVNLASVPAGEPILGSLQTFLTDWNDQLADIAAKRTAAQTYVASLKSLKTTFDALVKSATTDTRETEREAVFASIQTLEPSLAAIEKAFGPSLSATAAPKKG